MSSDELKYFIDGLKMSLTALEEMRTFLFGSNFS